MDREASWRVIEQQRRAIADLLDDLTDEQRESPYAYTYGEPGADSLAASFLRYLTAEVGKDIVRSHGHQPCTELQNPLLCRPS